MKMERQMNFKEDCRKRTEKIEEILRKYLPDQTGHQQIIEEGHGVQPHGRRQAAPPHADAGDL